MSRPIPYDKLNVVNEAIEYIPKKTKEGNPVTVRVPLNDKAKEILERHKEYKGKLLPFISEQKYNDAIKKIFKLAGVDRIVTILDPLTHNEVKRPIYEVQAALQGVLYRQYLQKGERPEPRFRTIGTQGGKQSFQAIQRY